LIMIRVLIQYARLSSGAFLGNGAYVSKRAVFDTCSSLNSRLNPNIFCNMSGDFVVFLHPNSVLG
jgi:hypothetical protein